jgi:hypothetical protein
MKIVTWNCNMAFIKRQTTVDMIPNYFTKLTFTKQSLTAHCSQLPAYSHPSSYLRPTYAHPKGSEAPEIPQTPIQNAQCSPFLSKTAFFCRLNSIVENFIDL